MLIRPIKQIFAILMQGVAHAAGSVFPEWPATFICLLTRR